MAISRILITGNVLRPQPAAPAVSESVARICWLQDLLSPPLSEVTNLPIERLACDRALSFGALYRDAGLEPSLDAWAELYAGELPPSMEQRLLDACQDALVISLEMPPSMARLLARAGIPVLDAIVDPLRFLVDIPLGWRSPHAGLREALIPFGVTPYEVKHRVAQIKAKMRWLPAPVLPEGATLVLDQLPSDAAMIDPRRRRRVAWSDYVEHVRELQREGPVVWRPHPYNADTSALGELLGSDTVRHENFYSLLTQDALVRVAAVSSGGVIEARAFGKEGLHFMDRFEGVGVPGWAAPIPVVGHWLSPHFFSAVLSDVIETRADVATLPVERDVFRRANNTDWEFGWIDQIVEQRTARESERAAVAVNIAQLNEHASQLTERVAALEQRAADLTARLSDATAQLADAHARTSEAIAINADRARIAEHAQRSDQQVRRLQKVDRPRLRALVDDVVRRARVNGWRVGVLGAGDHTAWMLRETDLRSLRSLYLFDSRPTSDELDGLPVLPSSRIPGMNLQVVIVSSLAFQEEMRAHLRSLGISGSRIVTCYPQEDDVAVPA
ncbi:MAG: hypothetical protein HOP16_00100 [Acidobacteria bacterium]|nr:hypothetical protein [Acidobacteriota bacterium]